MLRGVLHVLHTNLNKIQMNSKRSQSVGNTDALKMQKLLMYESQHPTDF